MALLSKLGSTISKEAQSSRVRDYSQDIIGVRGIVVVQFVGSQGLEQVLLVVAVIKVQATVVQDQLLILARLVGESIRDNATYLL